MCGAAQAPPALPDGQNSLIAVKVVTQKYNSSETKKS
jgi:hypothetical protein